MSKGPHHRQKAAEDVLELIRKKDYPDMPSRLAGAFATLQPATRFVSYGHLYEVEALGATLVANSYLIDQMWEEGNKAAYDAKDRYGYGKLTDQQQKWVNQSVMHAISWDAKQYWAGASVDKANVRNVEVIADKLKIIRQVDETHRLMRRMIFKAPIALTGGSHWDSDDRIKRIADDLKSAGCTIEYKDQLYSDRKIPKITIPQGTHVQICHVQFLGGGGQYDNEPSEFNPKYDAPLKSLVVFPMGMSRFPKGCESLQAQQSQEEPISSIVLDKDSIRAVVAAHKKGTLEVVSRE